jgi:phosphoribosylglycinamide formyltransferase 2
MIFTSPLKSNSTKIMLLGSGELGKEVAIEAQRLGVEVIAIDRYANAPAMLVANRSHVIDMKNYDELLEVIQREKPTYILPEIEAINIDALFEAERQGFDVIPNAGAVSKTMNRKNIRKFASEDLGLKTSKYEFVDNLEDLIDSCDNLGYPVVVKPVMSSSGHGQSIVKSRDEVAQAWESAKNARGDASELIVEEFVKFDYEITLLTARNYHGTVFCEPIGHIQESGDYIYSWQPMEMSETVKKKSEEIAKTITDGLGGRGLFGVELFIAGDEVYFSEVSPRPHDTGMVTMITQSQSEFALHVRAVLDLPLDFIFYGSGVSGAFKTEQESFTPSIDISDSEIEKEVFSKNSFFRVFGKPVAHKDRRMGVLLIFDEVQKGLEKAKNIISKIK